jgi:hypothetical protein
MGTNEEEASVLLTAATWLRSAGGHLDAAGHYDQRMSRESPRPQCSDLTAFVAFSTYPLSRLVHSRRSIENGDYKFLVAPNTR